MLKVEEEGPCRLRRLSAEHKLFEVRSLGYQKQLGGHGGWLLLYPWSPQGVEHACSVLLRARLASSRSRKRREGVERMIMSQQWSVIAKLVNS